MASALRPTIDWKRLLALAFFVGVGVYFWEHPVLWPLKLLVVMMHETGHALASLVVGGSVDKVVVASNESGACLSRLPPGTLGKIVVYSAGYLGSAVAGGLLLLATYRFRLRRAVLIACAVWLVLMAVLYAGDLFTFAFCAATAAVLAALARYLPESATEWLNLFLAAFSSLYAVLDLRDDLWNGAVRNRSDAALLAEITYVPALIWAALWTLLALALVGGFFYWAVGPTRRARATAIPLV